MLAVTIIRVVHSQNTDGNYTQQYCNLSPQKGVNTMIGAPSISFSKLVAFEHQQLVQCLEAPYSLERVSVISFTF